MPLRASNPAPQLLLIVQERLKPGGAEAYVAIECQIARMCARLKCPHPYLALESLGTPTEVWWLNMFASESDKDRVEREYARNKPLMTELGPLSLRKQAFTDPPTTLLTRHRPELSIDAAFQITGARFFVTASDERSMAEGAVFESLSGKYFVFASTASRADADRIATRAGASSAIFAVQPLWSFPAEEWVTADPDFWKPSGEIIVDSSQS